MKKKSTAATGKLGPRTKITIIPGKGVSQAINYMLEDRDELGHGRHSYLRRQDETERRSHDNAGDDDVESLEVIVSNPASANVRH